MSAWSSAATPCRASGAAGRPGRVRSRAQGKFWEMHARLFEHGGDFDRPLLRAAAEAVGLDVPRFLDDLDTGTQTARRVRDRRAATALGVNGLPAVFVNGLYLAASSTRRPCTASSTRRSSAPARCSTTACRGPSSATMMRNAATKRVAEPESAQALRDELAKAQAADKAVREPKSWSRPSPTRATASSPARRGCAGAEAPVVVVAFVDYQCPFCRRAWKEELSGVLARHPDDVALSVRQLPLPIHNAAEGAARAALAAGKQGKFWQFHDRLLAHEGALGRTNFVGWARELGLDEAAFLAALDDPATAKVVEQDTRLANRVGVDGTPGFFVNGRYVGGYTPGVLAGVIDEELARAAELARSEGTPPARRFAKDMESAIPESEFPNP
ncbi:MAG: DsbA family protein [Nannocystaceae bacterium]